MTDSPPLSRSDQPFPGAHSQVPGAHSGESDLLPAGAPASTRLPLQASAARSDKGWTIRLPVRAEHVTVSKRVVVRERVVIGRETFTEAQRVRADVRREEARLTTHGEARATE
jgi:hypothetical protein